MLATISLATVSIAMLVAGIYHIYLTSVQQGYGHLYRGGGQGGSLSIVTPIKDEPLEVVEKYLELFSRLIGSVRGFVECIIVADYTDDTLFNSILQRLSTAHQGILLVRRLNGAGGRNGAINTGIGLALGDLVALIDIDAEPLENGLESMARCSEVCISWWRVCDKGVSRISRTVAFITEYGSWLYYWLKSCRGLFLYPLGSGTVLRRELLTSIGGLREDVIQDDIWLGTQLIYRGIKPVIIEPLCVGAPKTLESFLIQQRRWVYGAIDVLKRFGVYILKAPVAIGIRIEALIYITQPLIASLGGLGLVLSVASAFTETEGVSTIHIVLIALLTASMALESIAVNRFLKWSRDPHYDVPYIVGRASALSLILSIATLPYALAAVVGVRIPYRVTPKGEPHRRVPLTIKVIALVFTASLIASIVRGNGVAAIVVSMAVASSIYALIRLR